MPNLASILAGLFLASAILVVGAVAFIYSGTYPMGADAPHTTIVYQALETLRERSINRAAAGVIVPDDLNTSSRLLAGGSDYNEMCADCHLRPGRDANDLTLGLYPAPPRLTADIRGKRDLTLEYQRRFWIIKHGIKASGMPAWGPTHSDERIWNMVAFIERLPSLTAEHYQILTARRAATVSEKH